MTAVFLGVTDLHLLARLLSFGLFALPTALYHLALVRVKDDAVLLAAVIAAIAMVFMTTSFFIVGEYNTAYAIAILVAVRLATAERLTVVDGLVLAVIGGLAIRTYEAMIYLGPLLSLMVLWAIWRAPARPWLPTLLHLLAIVGFIAGMFVAIGSLTRPYSVEHLDETIETATNFWQNMQFDLAVGGRPRGRGVGAGAAARPRAGQALSLGGRLPRHPGAVAAADAGRRRGAAARQVAIRGAHGGRTDHRLDRGVHLGLRLQPARQAAGLRRPRGSRERRDGASSSSPS